MDGGLTFTSVTTAVDNLMSVVSTVVTAIFSNPLLAAIAVSGLVFTAIRIWKRLMRGRG